MLGVGRNRRKATLAKSAGAMLGALGTLLAALYGNSESFRAHLYALFWTGNKLICPADTELTLRGKSFDHPRQTGMVSARGDCRLRLIDCDLGGKIVLFASDESEVTVEGGAIHSPYVAITVRDQAKVTIRRTRIYRRSTRYARYRPSLVRVSGRAVLHVEQATVDDALDAAFEVRDRGWLMLEESAVRTRKPEYYGAVRALQHGYALIADSRVSAVRRAIDLHDESRATLQQSAIRGRVHVGPHAELTRLRSGEKPPRPPPDPPARR